MTAFRVLRCARREEEPRRLCGFEGGGKLKEVGCTVYRDLGEWVVARRAALRKDQVLWEHNRQSEITVSGTTGVQ
jgi:hypothetical protein